MVVPSGPRVLATGRESADLGNPIGQTRYTLWIQFVEPLLGPGSNAHQLRVAQSLQVLRDCGRADLESPGDIPGRHGACGKHFHDALAGWIGESGEALHTP